MTCCEWVIMRIGFTQNGKWCMVMTFNNNIIPCECQRTSQICGNMPPSQIDWDDCQRQFSLLHHIEWEQDTTKILENFIKAKTVQTMRGRMVPALL